MVATMGIDVIATTISGSIKDWGKVQRIVPLFRERGRRDVALHVVDTHAEARRVSRDLVAGGGRILISAGGSGTFNSVLEGCLDSEVPLREITLGFLRKGSADLLGKVLGMSDEIADAVTVFVESLARGITVPCDVIRVESEEGAGPPRHFVGYGGAGIFGRIPHYTENRFIKYYKGVLSQTFGDLGPFFVGASLASLEASIRRLGAPGVVWRLEVDGVEAAPAAYQALILVNGDLGADLPFAKEEPLGSGDFHLFGLRDLGLLRLPGQFRRAFDGSIMADPGRWGLERYRVRKRLRISRRDGRPFPVNVDGSTMVCGPAGSFRIVDSVRLISRG